MTDAAEQESARWEALSWRQRYQEVAGERDRLRAERDEWTIERTIGQAQLDHFIDVIGQFLAQWDVVEPEIADAFLHRYLRFGQYTGPTIEIELAALRAALKEPTHD